MKFSKSSLIVFTILTIGVSSAYGKKTVEEVLDTATVKQQFDYVLKRSTTYEDYKVIKLAWINKFKANLLDSLQESGKALVYAHMDVRNRQHKIDSLTNTLQQTESKLTIVTKEKDSISFLGFMISKSSYNGLMTGIIVCLAVLLGTMIFLFKRSNSITSRTKSDLAEIKEEYETHRKSSREREEKMARRHLDEILKYKNQKQSTQFSTK